MEETLQNDSINLVEQLVADPTQVDVNHLTAVWSNLVDSGVDLGKRLLAALVIYFVGKWIIKLLRRIMEKMLVRHNLEPSVKTFIGSLINVLLTVLLLIAVISTLGIETTSFAALLASAGVAIGMALSGQLSNFTGGLMILLFKPYKVGDYLEAQGQAGVVQAIQMFQTVLTTTDNKTVIIPNGAISSGIMVNYSTQPERRVDFSFGLEYGQDFEKAREVLLQVIQANSKILSTPAPFIELGSLSASSVDITVRVWVKGADYWDVFFYMNKNVYAAFNKAGIPFPFPQLTVHQAKS
ncbi:MAG: mechanosensitive ion channel [Paludibacteraceae bacterium]|nr:mechanosensitive ion channel [Paludibacteraceae bacterium]